VDEAGVPGYRPEAWYGLLTSAAVPRAIVAKLNREITGILSEPELRQRLTALGIEPRPTTPEAFDRLIRDEVGMLTKVARAANIRAD
jgi:tripartite-type tricarboxylate transporter receptor subunit TctC